LFRTSIKMNLPVNEAETHFQLFFYPNMLYQIKK
jgi:hypothetical protein